ncbi:MAG: sugar phosphate isomerase/epimerase family protein [Phycisphaeraceae bacterium]
MAIKLAFSTVACPEWTLEQVAERARQMGYDGVELRTLGSGSSDLACEPALTQTTKIHDLFKAVGVEPVCLSTSTALHHRNSTAAKDACFQISRDLDTAAEIGCRFVRIFGNEVSPGEARNAVIQRIAERLGPLGDKAGQVGVQLLLENAGSFCGAKEWWWLLNLVNHPMIGLSWNVANAAAIGEPAAVSVPMLHSRIGLAKVKDLHVGEGSGYVPLGEGTVGIEPFIKRLLGVGYDGYVSVEWDRLWLASLTPADQYLPDAQQRLKGWLETITEAGEKGRKAAEKAAQKNAPKPTPAPEPPAEPAAKAG